MKHNPAKIISACIASVLLLLAAKGRADSVSYTNAGTFTWNCPAGVTNVQVQCWGGGGAGGSAQKGGTGSGGGGGGGGAYASNSISVTPGTVYTLMVGGGGTPTSAAGNNIPSPNGLGTNSWFGIPNSSTTNCLAVSGGAGTDENSTAGGGGAGGAGGVAASCIGTTTHSGGAGATASASRGGGGGSSAGTGSNGNSGGPSSGTTYGNPGTAVTGGGAGGAGIASGSGAAGNNGGAPGGGGGGNENSAHSATYVGGYGAAGQVILTYTVQYDHVNIETAPDGSGSIVPAQNVTTSLTVYAIGRGAGNPGAFISNCPSIWSLQNISGSVVSSDLVASGDTKSAVFTAHLSGSANIQAASAAGNGTDNSSGLITVPSTGVTSAWNVNSDSTWSTAGNWSSGVPSVAGDTAIFGVSSALRMVTLDVNKTVGTMNFTNANSFMIAASGGNTLTLDKSGEGAQVNVTGGTANAIQTPIALNDNLTASVSSGQSLAISGVVSNATTTVKTLIMNGAGTLALSGNNSYGPAAGTVGTTLSGGGTLQVGNNNALGAGDLSLSASGTLQAGTSVSLANNIALSSGIMATLDSDGNSFTLGGSVSGSGSVTKIGGGTLTLNSANSYVNNTAITAGTLKLGIANAIPNGGATTGWLILDGGTSAAGTLDLNGFNQGVNALSGLTGAVTGQIVNNSGSGTSALTVSGSSSTAFAGSIEDNNNSTAGKVALIQSGTGTLTLSGASTYSGGTTLSAGQLNINNGGSGSGNSAIGTGSLTIAGGTIDNTSGSSVTLQPVIAEAWNGDFTFIGSSALNLASGTVTMGANRTLTVNASTLNVGAIGDNGSNYSLTKAGSGTLVLDAAGTYGGGTTQSAGVILVSNNFALGYGPFAHAVGSVQLGNGVNVTNSFNNATSDTSDAMIDCPSGAATWSGPVNSSGSGGLRIANDGGTLTLTGTGSNRGIIFEYGTLIFAGSANFINGNASGNIWDIGRDPAGSGRTASLTLENSATFSTSNTGMGFGGGKVTGACTLTIQDNASLNLGTGTFDLHTASSGTSANTINLNGGTLTLGAFIKSDTIYAATMNLNGGVITAGVAGAILPGLPVLTVNVGTNGAKINDNGFAISIAQPLLGTVSDDGLTRSGAGTLTLTGTNTYNGATTISSGALALSGSGSISNSAGIVLTNDAKFDVTGLSSMFTLSAGQILTNIMGTGLIAGNVNLNSGLLALNYSNGVPALAITNGTLNFNSNAVTVTVSGAPLAVGTYTLIATNTAGLVAGTLPASVTVNGSGAAAAASLQIANGELNLVIAANHPPVAAPMTVYRTAGLNLKIALSDLATNWSDPDGDTVTLAGINLLTTNGVNLATNNTWITYTNGPNVNDQFSYTISDGQATATGVVNIVVNSTAAGNNSIAAITQGNPTMIKAYGIPGYTYITQRTTSMSSPDWVNISTNTAAVNGAISVTDAFSDLGGNAPPSAYYRLSWNP